MSIERAEAGARPQMTNEDRKYRGIGRHPLARRWMLNRLIEAREAAEQAESEERMQHYADEVERITGELRDCGIKLKGEKR